MLPRVTAAPPRGTPGRAQTPRLRCRAPGIAGPHRRHSEAALRIAHGIGGRSGVPEVRVGVHTGSAVERDGGRRVRLIDAEEAFSFAYGALGPKVVISRGLADRASDEELVAILVDEPEAHPRV